MQSITESPPAGQSGRSPANPPAFPQTTPQMGGGMDLRDYFAAKAIEGVVAAYLAAPEGTALDNFDPKQWANHAYSLADAMLERRGAK
jgi:hypothetical protein